MAIYTVTGAFGFTGKYIAKRLLDAGHEVNTLTNSPGRENPFGGRVRAFPYNFDDPDKLAESLTGTDVLYNNYWVRFNYKKSDDKGFTYAGAIQNSVSLFEAAKKAGVRRVVHISITNPSEDSPLEYFSGKAALEKALIETGLSYAILRPAVIFGKEDILVNNIAWFLRRFPVFGVFGCGDYKLQPIYVEDLAGLAVEQGKGSENVIIDAVGPETYTYIGLVKEIRKALGIIRPIVPVPPWVGSNMGDLVGRIFGDVTITRDEIRGLMAGLLYTGSPPAGKTKLSDWLRENSETIGAHYSSELARRSNRTDTYSEI